MGVELPDIFDHHLGVRSTVFFLIKVCFNINKFIDYIPRLEQDRWCDCHQHGLKLKLKSFSTLQCAVYSIIQHLLITYQIPDLCARCIMINNNNPSSKGAWAEGEADRKTGKSQCDVKYAVETFLLHVRRAQIAMWGKLNII